MSMTELSKNEPIQDGGHATTGTIFRAAVKGIRGLYTHEISSDSSNRIIIGSVA